MSNWLTTAISNSLSLSWETTTPCQLIRFASISTPCKSLLWSWSWCVICDLLFVFLSVGYGLKQVTASARLAKNGPNLVNPPTDWPWWCKLVFVHFSGFAPLLWVATFLVFLSWQPFGTPPTNLYNLILAIVLIFVIVISSMFTFYQVSLKCFVESVVTYFDSFCRRCKPPRFWKALLVWFLTNVWWFVMELSRRSRYVLLHSYNQVVMFYNAI